MNKYNKHNMNENHFDAIVKKYQNVSMSPNEKREVFRQTMLVIEKIEAVALTHGDLHKVIRPIEGHDTETHTHTSSPTHKKALSSYIPKIISIWSGYVSQKRFVPVMLTVLVLLGTGGASALAEKALPGDSLYKIKVNINEPIREFAAVSTEAKARVAIEATERRLQEAAVLSSQGKLDESNKKILQNQFTKNTNQIRNQVASMVSKNDLLGSENIFRQLEATLVAHSKVLDSFANDASSTPSTDGIDTGVDIAHTSSTDPQLLTTSGITSISTGTPTTTSLLPNGTYTPVQANMAVKSLLEIVKDEIKTTKIVRKDIEDKSTITGGPLDPNTSASSVSFDKSINNQALLDNLLTKIQFNIEDIESELKAPLYDTKAFVYSDKTQLFAKKRIEHASTTIEEIKASTKTGIAQDALTKARTTSQSLIEVLVVLRLEKASKNSLDGKIDIESLINSDNSSSTVQ